MKRPRDIRASPREWSLVLKTVYPFLQDRGIGDLLIYGSQAMSLYMSPPLRSKDLDLVSGQMTPAYLEELRRVLSNVPEMAVRSTQVQTRRFNDRIMRTYSVELRIGVKPFFVELFDAILDGRSPSILRGDVRLVKKWGLELWAPSPEAIVALRLAFRTPEGISRLNAVRVNNFIKQNLRHLNFATIRELIRVWNIGDWIASNLEQLYGRHRLRILKYDKMISSLKL